MQEAKAQRRALEISWALEITWESGGRDQKRAEEGESEEFSDRRLCSGLQGGFG